MRCLGWAMVALAALAACGEEDTSRSTRLDPGAAPVAQGAWYRPGVAATWQWQLDGAINTGYAAEIYDVDLFDAPQQVLDSLKAQGRRVLCYFSAGSSEDWRPDANQLPDSVIGDPMGDWEGEAWLDVRKDAVLDVMLGRLDRARQRGCDGVEPDNVDGFVNETGFSLTAEDQLAFNRFLANAAHERGLAVALKNDLDQIPELVAYFDLALNEECHAYGECQRLAPFPSSGKPALNAEYAPNLAEARTRAQAICAGARAAQLRTLILPLALDDSFRVSCED